MDRIARFFEARIAALTEAGVARDRLILDPGMGFFLGADPEASFDVLRRLPELKARVRPAGPGLGVAQILPAEDHRPRGRAKPARPALPPSFSRPSGRRLHPHPRSGRLARRAGGLARAWTGRQLAGVMHRDSVRVRRAARFCYNWPGYDPLAAGERPVRKGSISHDAQIVRHRRRARPRQHIPDDARNRHEGRHGGRAPVHARRSSPPRGDRQGHAALRLHDRAGAGGGLHRGRHGCVPVRPAADAGRRHADALAARRSRRDDLRLAQSLSRQRHQAVRARRPEAFRRDTSARSKR